MEYFSPRSETNALLDDDGEAIFDKNAWRHFLALGPYLGRSGSSLVCPKSGKNINIALKKVLSSDDVSYWLLTDEKLNFNNAKYPRDAFFSVCPHHPYKSYIASTANGGAMNVHWPKMRQQIIKGLLINGVEDSQQQLPKTGLREISILDAAKEGNIAAVKHHISTGTGKTGDWLKAGDSIHIAAKAGHIEAVKKHLADGADVNAIGKFRKASPLYMAAYSYNAEATKFLLDNGADVDQLDFEKETALHTAAYHSYHGEGDVSVVALLVDRGSKINAISDRGLTPLDLAIMAGTPEVSDLLRKHGGKTGEELKAEGK